MQPPPRPDDSSEVIPVPLGCQRMLRPPAAEALAGLVAVAFFAVILVLLLTFILENTQRVDISYFGVHGTCPVPKQPRAWPSRSCPAPRAPAAWTRTRPRAPRCPASTSQPSGPGVPSTISPAWWLRRARRVPVRRATRSHSRTASSGLELCSRRSSDRGRHLCKQGVSRMRYSAEVQQRPSQPPASATADTSS